MRCYVDVEKLFKQLLEIMNTLRSPGGCPWDREQTHASLKPYCIEEAYEVIDAIEKGDDSELASELGDLLLQVVFHAQLASEEDRFSMADVLSSINEKLIRRHPHVFRKEEGDEVENAKEVLGRWAEIKKTEGKKAILDGIPKDLPALLRASRVGEKAASVGFDWRRKEDVWKKIEEEMEELDQAQSHEKRDEEFGDLLFAFTNLARHLHIDSETSLRKATLKFEGRFQKMEELCKLQGKEVKECSYEELDDLWNQVKRAN